MTTTTGITRQHIIVRTEFDPDAPTGEGTIYIDQYGRRWQHRTYQGSETGVVWGTRQGNVIVEDTRL